LVGGWAFYAPFRWDTLPSSVFFFFLLHFRPHLPFLLFFPFVSFLLIVKLFWIAKQSFAPFFYANVLFLFPLHFGNPNSGNLDPFVSFPGTPKYFLGFFGDLFPCLYTLHLASFFQLHPRIFSLLLPPPLFLPFLLYIFSLIRAYVPFRPGFNGSKGHPFSFALASTVRFFPSFLPFARFFCGLLVWTNVPKNLSFG